MPNKNQISDGAFSDVLFKFSINSTSKHKSRFFTRKYSQEEIFIKTDLSWKFPAHQNEQVVATNQNNALHKISLQEESRG